MKILKDSSLQSVPQEADYGTTSFASFRRIVETMRATGELRMYAGEYVKSITISNLGLSFVIEKE